LKNFILLPNHQQIQLLIDWQDESIDVKWFIYCTFLFIYIKSNPIKKNKKKQKQNNKKEIVERFLEINHYDVKYCLVVFIKKSILEQIQMK
jgi:hypothetical protein